MMPYFELVFVIDSKHSRTDQEETILVIECFESAESCFNDGE